MNEYSVIMVVRSIFFPDIVEMLLLFPINPNAMQLVFKVYLISVLFNSTKRLF